MAKLDRDNSQFETTAPKAPKRAAKGKAQPAALPQDAALMESLAEERQRQMRALIALGRERGYLTHADINDHLPDNFTETAAMETARPEVAVAATGKLVL